MNFSALIGTIHDDYPVKSIKSELAGDVSDVALWEETQRPYASTTLYFGYYAQMKHQPLPPQCLLAVADGSIHLPGGHIAQPCGNVAITEERHLFPVFNRAKALVIGRMNIAGAVAEMKAGMLGGMPLKELINYAATKLANSLIVLDNSFKVIESSTIFPITDRLWVDILKRGYCTYAFTSAVAQLAGVKDAPDNDDASVVTCYASPLRKLYSKIYRGSRHIGYVIMLEQESDITPFHLAFLPHVSRALCEMLSRDMSMLSIAVSQYESLLYNLIIGASPEDVRNQIRASRLSFSASMCILSIKSTRHMGKAHMRGHVGGRLRDMLPGVHVVLHENNLIALVPLNGLCALPHGLKEQLAAFAKAEFVKIGVSHSFALVEHALKHCAEANAALKLSEAMNDAACVCDYEKYSFYDLLSNMDGIKPGGFCHPALARLNRYDQQNGTNLYETLSAYLDHAGNIKHTADALFIHRNTLTYRINRIAEVAAADIDDPETRFLLAASYRIDRFSGLNRV